MRILIVILEQFMFSAIAMSWYNSIHKCIAKYRTMNLSQMIQLTVYKDIPCLLYFRVW